MSWWHLAVVVLAGDVLGALLWHLLVSRARRSRRRPTHTVTVEFTRWDGMALASCSCGWSRLCTSPTMAAIAGRSHKRSAQLHKDRQTGREPGRV